MKKLFIGIDISKDVFDFYGISETGETVIPSGILFNSKKGIKSFLTMVKKYTGYEPHMCMEHTGLYGYLLMTEFSSASMRFSVINPLEMKLSSGLARGKNDAVDALRIAKYALANRFDLNLSPLPTVKSAGLKSLWPCGMVKSRLWYSKKTA